jgi:DNA-binding response OmpR family regulator
MTSRRLEPVDRMKVMDSTSVLIVDDETSVRCLLRLYLSNGGFNVIEADNGTDGLSLLRRGGVDIALVDLMLPGIDGFSLVREIRKDSTIPILLVTARSEEPFRVTGLGLGADDYVVKPFSPLEVVARVRAHLRRARDFASEEAPLRVGSLQLDRVERRCTVGGRPVTLTRREFDLLATLLTYPGHVFTRIQLLESVWDSIFVSQKTVDVHVAGLRRKVGNAVRITALRGVGYRLEA